MKNGYIYSANVDVYYPDIKFVYDTTKIEMSQYYFDCYYIRNNSKYNINLDDYLNHIFEVVDTLENTFISYRLWVDSSNVDKVLNKLNEKYNTSLSKNSLKKNNKLKDNIYLNKEEEFIWPSMNNNYYNENGKCYGLIDHIGVLVDGTIIPCCLDTLGIINLGNIFKDDISSLKDNKLCNEMIRGFKNNKKVLFNENEVKLNNNKFKVNL